MDPSELIAPESPLGLPAPFWFLVSLKVIGFTMHSVPMNLWYAGILVAMLARISRNPYAVHWSARLMRQMPVIVALGVNFGIVPLLFLQVAYYRAFYPATVLTAWPWLSIIALLVVAYYGVYIYVGGLRDDTHVGHFRKAFGWLSAITFVFIGFLFANGLSLMTNVVGWPKIWASNQAAGAVLGTALNTGDPSLLPRWLMMFGLALTTAAAYATVDAGLFARTEPTDYRSWVARFSLGLYSLGMLWFAAAGTWYVFGTWQPEVRQTMLQPPLLFLTATTALSPGLTWLILAWGRQEVRRGTAFAVGSGQLIVLALNAVSRQIVQNLELSPYLQVGTERVNLQLTPMVIFLTLFLLGIGAIGWMVKKIVEAEVSDQT